MYIHGFIEDLKQLKVASEDPIVYENTGGESNVLYIYTLRSLEEMREVIKDKQLGYSLLQSDYNGEVLLMPKTSYPIFSDKVFKYGAIVEAVKELFPEEIVEINCISKGYCSYNYIFPNNRVCIPTSEDAKSYGDSSESTILKFGDYELNLGSTAKRITDRYRTYHDVRQYGNTLISTNENFSVLRNNNGTTVCFHVLNTKLTNAMLTKEFWEKFIFPIFNASTTELMRESFIKDFSIVSEVLLSHMHKKEKEELAALQNSNTILAGQIQSYFKAISRDKILLERNDKRIISVQNDINNICAMKSSITKDLEGTNGLEYVDGIYVDGTIIVVYLKVILVDGVVPIGPYKVTLDIHNSSIHVENTGNQKERFSHPHVSNGEPCWGNYSDIYVHLNRGEILTTIELLHTFLSTWNPRDEWGRNLLQWDMKYGLQTYKDLDLLSMVSGYATEYREIFGESMPYDNGCDCSDCRASRGEVIRDENMCDVCGYEEDDCECYICVNCGEHYRTSDEVCPDCGYCRGCDDNYCLECGRCGECDCTCNRETEEV